MRKIFFIIMTFLTVYIYSDTINQVVIVTFENDNNGNINEINLTGPSVYLKISQDGNSDKFIAKNDTTNLSWYTNQRRKKITLSSSLPSSNMELFAKAINVSGGLSTGKILVSGYQKDIVTDIDKTAGICNIYFKAIAKKENFNTKDVHILTYTLTDS